MKGIELIPARMAASAVAEGGGYLTYDEYEIAVKPRLFRMDDRGRPLDHKQMISLYWVMCSKLNPNWIHNTTVLAAHLAVAAGLLENTGDGYRLLAEKLEAPPS